MTHALGPAPSRPQPCARNARLHRADRVAKIAAGISRLGWTGAAPCQPLASGLAFIASPLARSDPLRRLSERWRRGPERMD